MLFPALKHFSYTLLFLFSTHNFIDLIHRKEFYVEKGSVVCVFFLQQSQQWSDNDQKLLTMTDHVDYDVVGKLSNSLLLCCEICSPYWRNFSRFSTAAFCYCPYSLVVGTIMFVFTCVTMYHRGTLFVGFSIKQLVSHLPDFNM